MRSRAGTIVVAIGALATAGCTVEAPFDPGQLVGGVDDLFQSVQDRVSELLADPLDSRPYPSLLGGDSERIFYATNLGDIRIKFRGPTNDLVLPGLLGPSNLYRIQDGQRELLRPLIPAGALSGLGTDGQYVVYVFVLDAERPGLHRLVAGELGGGRDRTLLEVEPDAAVILPPLAVHEGRVACVVSDWQAGTAALRVLDLASGAEVATVEQADFASFDLRAGRLVYAAPAGGTSIAITLRSLGTGAETGVATVDPGPAGWLKVLLTDNKVVWAEPVGGGLSRIVAYDIPAGTTRVWVDAVAGELAGAHDDFFVTQETIFPASGRPERIAIRRYDSAGRSRVLADFRAHGLAGQARILGNRVVFVNAQRRIVAVPLTGGGRTSYAAY